MLTIIDSPNQKVHERIEQKLDQPNYSIKVKKYFTCVANTSDLLNYQTFWQNNVQFLYL